MRTPRWLVGIAATILSSTLILGCSDEFRYSRSCDVPNIVDRAEVTGVWQTEYRNYLDYDSEQGATPISGVERLIVLSDGTYVQTFDSPSYTYASKPNPWHLVHEKDGPKLEMAGLRYFPNGVAASNGKLRLSIQTPDVIHIQDQYGWDFDTRSVKLAVQYPTDGFVYLYPRNCTGKFVLLQMVSRQSDPDDPTVHNPVFEKIGD